MQPDLPNNRLILALLVPNAEVPSHHCASESQIGSRLPKAPLSTSLCIYLASHVLFSHSTNSYSSTWGFPATLQIYVCLQTRSYQRSVSHWEQEAPEIQWPRDVDDDLVANETQGKLCFLGQHFHRWYPPPYHVVVPTWCQNVVYKLRVCNRCFELHVVRHLKIWMIMRVQC
jgi:hypothetical protein